MSGRSLKDGEVLTPTDMWAYEWDEPTDQPAETTDELTDHEIAEHNNRLLSIINKQQINQ